MSSITNRQLSFVAAAIIALCIVGCANRGSGPQGGPKDETPPKIMKETPENGTLNYQKKTITVQFDEYIQLDKVQDNVLISPPQQRPPEVKAIGKRLSVEFEEDLQDSTTYTIDFGAAICDNNEKNPLRGYTFSFATGDVIDSLQIAGLMLNAEDLNPISGIIVGVHNNMEDSALQTEPFVRIGRTDADGYFTIKNLKAGNYRLYGLQDVSKDYLYQAGEGLAIYDEVISPVCHTEIKRDTIWKDSIEIDSIISVPKVIYEPDNIILMFFNEDKQRHYFQRVYREQAHFFRLVFAAPQDSLPQIRPLLEETDSVDWWQYVLCQPNITYDTITYWLTDSAAIRLDSLHFEMTYMKSDSLYELQPQTDSIYAVYRAPRLSERAKAQLAKNKKQTRVDLQFAARSPFDVYPPIILTSQTPLDSLREDMFHLYQKVDTVNQPVPIDIQATDSTHTRYQITPQKYKNTYWEAEQNYEWVIDSAAVKDIYHNVNEVKKGNFKIKSLDEYSTLSIKLEPFDSRAIIQILDEKDAVVRTLPAAENGTKFEYLQPKSYYFRIFIDIDGNGKWTTGDFLTHRQPEPVYYFHSKLTLRANWDFEETFRYLELPQDEQKPEELWKDASQTKSK